MSGFTHYELKKGPINERSASSRIVELASECASVCLHVFALHNKYSTLYFFNLVDEFEKILFFQLAELQFYWVNDHYFRNGDKEMCHFFFWAHLSPWLMVSYCDRWMSFVRRASSTIASKNISSETTDWI